MQPSTAAVEHDRTVDDPESVDLSPLGGIQAANLLLGATADNVANADTPDYHRTQVTMATDADGGVEADVGKADEPGVDLAEEMVNLVVARTMYTADARVLSVQAEAERSLFDARA